MREGIGHERRHVLLAEGREIDAGEIHPGVAVGIGEPDGRRQPREDAGAAPDLGPAVSSGVDIEPDTGRPEHLAARGPVRPVAGELAGETVVGQRLDRQDRHVGPQSEVQAEPRTHSPGVLGVETQLNVVPSGAWLFDAWHAGTAQEVTGRRALLESLDTVEFVGPVVVLYEQVVEGDELVVGADRYGVIRPEQVEVVGELEGVLVQRVGLGEPFHAEPDLAEERSFRFFEIDLDLGKGSRKRRPLVPHATVGYPRFIGQAA